jgi:hypothetical protein
MALLWLTRSEKLPVKVRLLIENMAMEIEVVVTSNDTGKSLRIGLSIAVIMNRF